MAPRSALLPAHMRPPWESTIDRQIARPRPSPSCFEVTKGSKTESPLIPVPRSLTDRRTAEPSSFVVIVMSRSDGGSASAIIARARASGVRTLVIKSADGGDYWSQFSPGLVRELRSGSGLQPGSLRELRPGPLLDLQ